MIMRYFFRYLLAFLVFITLALIYLTSCVKRPSLVYDQPELMSDTTGHYERAWIDPQIIYSDSIITVIRSEKIDSFYVKKPDNSFNEKIISLVFDIKEEDCFTSIFLLDNSGNVISVPVTDDLSYGQYKVSINPSRINYVQSNDNRFFLKSDFCGFSVIKEVPLQ